MENRGKLFSKRKIKFFPFVSIIVPAYNEEKVIAATLKNALKLNYPKNKLEILVIDDGSSDKTYEIAKRFESNIIKVYKKARGGKANAINFALKIAKGDFVVIMDADSLPYRNALINCLKYFDSPKVAAVTSNILPKKRSFLEKLQYIELMFNAFFRKLQEFPNVISSTPGPFSVYRKEILKKVGGFDEKNLVEDVEIAWRLHANGYLTRMAMDARVDTYFPSTISHWWKQRTRWAIGNFQTFVKYFKYIFRKDKHAVGRFLLPTSLTGYIITTFIVTLFVYFIVIQFSVFSIVFIKSISLGANPLSVLLAGGMIDVRIIYGILSFLLFFTMLKLVLGAYRIKIDLFHIIIYGTLYVMLTPFVTLNGIYKYMRKDFGWQTK